jgi:hypothetical protein
MHEHRAVLDLRGQAEEVLLVCVQRRQECGVHELRMGSNWGDPQVTPELRVLLHDGCLRREL